MRSAWMRRIKETVAILAIGDGAIEVLAPREHSRLWLAGPEGIREVTRFFADHPNYMRLLGAAQIVFGLWLALRQYREGE
jgi:hypothetical protein